MNKKLVLVTGLLTISLFMTACNKKTSSSTSVNTTDTTQQFVHKTNEGIPAVFEEELGFYDKDASLIQLDDNTRVVYYTTNETKNVTGDVIGFRKAVKNGDTWVWGEKQIVLKPTADSWDSSRVSNPDVIKGVFAYNGETYNYLMAYQGNNIEALKNYQIGLAFAKAPEGPWVKYDKPFVAYNPDIYGSQFGAGQPSLVSFDKEGKVRLFYTFADELLTSTRVMELDLSDMSHVSGDQAYLTISEKGLEDKDLSALPIVNNADFAIDKDTNKLYIIRDRNPYASSAPGVAETLQLAEADLSILYVIEPQEPSWTLIDKSINDSDTATDTTTGWQRIYSGSLITDTYGQVLSASSFEICFSSSAVAQSASDTSYEFSPALHVLTVNK